MRHAGLSDDMVRTAELFAKLFGQQQMELRWEVTEHQSCPKFHCDNVYKRMLVTYFGPTTVLLPSNLESPRARVSLPFPPEDSIP